MSEPSAGTPRPDYDFPTVCADAIFLERTTRMTRGEQMKRSDVIRIIREQDALRLDKPKPDEPSKASSKRSKALSSPFGDRKRIPPSPDDVTAYSASIGYPLDGLKWCDFYGAKGWAVGKTRMKDWQCAVRNWRTSGWGVGTICLGPAKPKAPENYDKI